MTSDKTDHIRVDSARIDHCAGYISEMIDPAQKISVGNVPSRCVDRSHIDKGSMAEIHARRIGDIDLPVCQ